jgi:dipeptidase
VGQARQWLPDAVGGILWFGTDDAATSPLTPIYSSSTRVPWCFSTANGNMLEYSDTAMFWLTNRVTNFAYLRYDMISADIRKVLDEWENSQLESVKAADEVAVTLYDKKPAKAVKYLTEYSVDTAQKLFDKWSELDKYLLVKYIDGNVKKEDANGFITNGNPGFIPEFPDQPGYDERWKRTVAGQDDGTLKER